MNRKSALMIAGLVVASLAPTAFADKDGYEREHGFWGRLLDHDDRHERGEMKRVRAVSDPLYKEECGSCHMAYPADLLPAESWRRIMAGLADHFGDNAELAPETAQRITQFLVQNSSNTLSKEYAPTRITEAAYFRHEHRELPARYVKGNPKVNSFANCQACHSRAESGSFNEHDVRIPGVGRWED